MINRNLGNRYLQQAAAPAAFGPMPGGQRQGAVNVDVITQLTQYTVPGSQVIYRVGDAAAANVLMKIEEDGQRQVTLYWFNFILGQAQSGPPSDWASLRGYAVFARHADRFVAVGRALTAEQWRSLWPDPREGLLKLHEEKQINLSDDAVADAYRSMIYTTAVQVLDENERSVDALLDTPDQVRFFQEYAAGLREAAEVRDVLETRKSELEHSMAQMQGFSVGMAGREIGMNPVRRLDLVQQMGAVDRTLAFWKSSFPLLTRMRTADIRAGSVEEVLRDIKASIIATRRQLALAPLRRARFDLWELDKVREQVDAKLGPRATAAVRAEDTSRTRWGWVKAAGLVAGSIALLFVPGGAFIDLAIGVAMGVDAIDHARDLGQLARTGMHVDDALVSSAVAESAVFEAVVATIFAVLGGAAAGVRVLRVGRLLLRVRRAAPAMGLAGQVRVARLLAKNPGWLRAGQDLGELNAAVRRAGGALRFEEIRALRELVYEAQGQLLPSHSRESLEELLGRVWADRRRLISRSDDILQRNAEERAAAAQAGRVLPRGEAPWEPIADVYSGTTEVNSLTRPAADYFREIADIAHERPPGAVSTVQGTRGETIGEAAGSGRLARGGYENRRFRFPRAGADLGQVRERIYLNAKADHATEVMRTVVKDIVDNPDQYPGVVMAKLVGPGGIAEYTDGIVIYATDTAAVRRVMERIRAYHAANPRSFQKTTPYITDRVLEGVSVGAEPLAVARGSSFGSLRSRVIYDALRSSMRRGDGPEEFMREVFDGLRGMGVDPVKPHLNLPPAGTP